MHWVSTSEWPLASPLSLHWLPYCFEVVGLATASTCLTKCRSLPLWMTCTTVHTVLIHHVLILPDIVLLLLISHNRVKFLGLSDIAQHHFCFILYHLWAHISNWLVVVSLISVSSHNILPVMTWSSNPWINCSANLLQYLWYSLSVASVCILPIHSWVDWLLFHLSFQYCRNNTIQYWSRRLEFSGTVHWFWSKTSFQLLL